MDGGKTFCCGVTLIPLLVAGCGCCGNRSPLPASEEVGRVCSPRDVTADDTYVYLACSTSIERISLRGGQSERLVEEPERPNRIAVHGGSVYWTTVTNRESFKSAPKSGGDGEVLPVSVRDPDAPILADESGIYLVAARVLGDEVGLVHYTPSTKTLRHIAKVEAYAACAIDDTHLYWAAPNGKELKTVPKKGGVVQVLTTSKRPILSITTTQDAVYYSAVAVAREGGLMRIPRAGGSPEQLFLVGVGSELFVNQDWACWSKNSRYTSKLAASYTAEVHCIPNRRVEIGERATQVFAGSLVHGLMVRGGMLHWVGRSQDEPKGATLRKAVLKPR
jgi:hypothetical protein